MSSTHSGLTLMARIRRRLQAVLLGRRESGRGNWRMEATRDWSRGAFTVSPQGVVSVDPDRMPVSRQQADQSMQALRAMFAARSEVNVAAGVDLASAHLIDGCWYWTQRETLGGSMATEPALYRSEAKAFYSATFAGVPAHEVRVLGEIAPCEEATTAPSDDAGVIDVDVLAQFIRKVDGNNTLGAATLAERIVERFGRERAASARESSSRVDWREEERLRLLALRQALTGFTVRVENAPLVTPAAHLEEVVLSCEFQPGQGHAIAQALRDFLAEPERVTPGSLLHGDAAARVSPGLVGEASSSALWEGQMLRAAFRLHLGFPVERYLLSCTHGRWDGAEKAQRHDELCAAYVAAALGIHDIAEGRGSPDFEMLHSLIRKATRELTDALDETIGFPVNDPRPDLYAFTERFFDRFHVIAFSVIDRWRDAARPQAPQAPTSTFGGAQ